MSSVTVNEDSLQRKPAKAPKPAQQNPKPFAQQAAGYERVSLLMLQCGVLVLLCLLPSLLLGSLIERRASIWVGGLSSLLGAASSLVWLLGQPRRSSMQKVVGGCVVMLMTALVASIIVVLRWPATSGSLLRSVIDAVTYGWSTIVTSPVPAFAQPRSLVPVSLVSCCAAAASVGTAVLSRSRLLPLLPSFVAFLLAAIAAGRQQFAAIPTGLALVVLSGLIVWIRTSVAELQTHKRPVSAEKLSAEKRPSENLASEQRSLGKRSSKKRQLHWRKEAPMLAIVAAIAIVGALIVGPTLTFGRDAKPFDPRDRIVPPSLPKNIVNPLELVGSRRQSKQQLMFTVRASTPLIPQDLRLVTLNNFDGASWTTTAAYERAGAVLEPAITRTVRTTPITAEITVAASETDDPWILSMGDPTAVTGVNVLTDPTSGSLVAAEPIRPNTTYRIVTSRAEPDAAPLVLTPVGSSNEAKQALVVAPGLPPLLDQMARTAIGDAERPFERAYALQNYLRLNFTVSASKAGGYSYGHLEIAFTKNGEATEEQFAAMFATLGRTVGLPTRIVVGFSPGPPDANGVVKVFASDARVWPEVLFENVGWVPFVATPASDGSRGGVRLGSGNEITLESAPPTPPQSFQPPAITAGCTGDCPLVQQKSRSVFVTTAIVAGAAAGISGLCGALIVGLKRRKTARRRNGSPRQAVMGAWQDVLDRLRESGVAKPEALTVDELIQQSETTSAALAGMHRPVNSALYSDADITEADQLQAWRARDRFVQSLNRQSSRRQRFRHAIDPRPLLVSSRVNGAQS
jgi:transglutaminase-like putative cysteine protease